MDFTFNELYKLNWIILFERYLNGSLFSKCFAVKNKSKTIKLSNLRFTLHSDSS
jgi:hypothetical protein